MDVGSKASYPANALSNFSPHPFVFDGVLINSAEGFLQSLKFDKPHIQVEVCKMVGISAKMKGKNRNKHWKRKQSLWWMGMEMDRHGQEYQDLIERFYTEMTIQSESFRNALIASGKSVFTHSIGRNKESETVLTEREFCRMLNLAREIANNYNNEKDQLKC